VSRRWGSKLIGIRTRTATRWFTRKRVSVTSRRKPRILHLSSARDVPSLYGKDDVKLEIVWLNVVVAILLHSCFVYSLTLPKHIGTLLVHILFTVIAGFGITIGAHRLYTHRCFRANKTLQILLVTFQTMAVQNSMYEWVRDHRAHHKYCDTNADPHNIQRGFFFAHMGWLMCKKHPDVKKFGPRVDMSDLERDPIVMFQHKYYKPLALFFGFILPMAIVMPFGESIVSAWHFNVFRYLIMLHGVWSVNSIAHCWGNKPYDKRVLMQHFWRNFSRTFAFFQEYYADRQLFGRCAEHRRGLAQLPSCK
jgi:stearoyl-CoA desaturase (delta-9 desaturase)